MVQTERQTDTLMTILRPPTGAGGEVTRRHLDKFLFVVEIKEVEVSQVGERLGDVRLDRLDTNAEHHHAASHVLVLRDHLVVVSRHRLDC